MPINLSNLYYYDNKNNGEVDYLIDDADQLTVLPFEIKSGKDYAIHSALNKLLKIKEYSIHQGFVLSNEQKVYQENGITYLPIYDIMFFEPGTKVVGELWYTDSSLFGLSLGYTTFSGL